MFSSILMILDQEKERELYTVIGQFILNSLKSQKLENQWEKVSLHVEYNEGVTNYYAKCIWQGNAKSMGFAPYDISNTIKELKDYTTKRNFTPWRKFVFELYPTYKFNITFVDEDNL